MAGEPEEGDPVPSVGLEGAIYTLVKTTIFEVLKEVFVYGHVDSADKLFKNISEIKSKASLDKQVQYR
ncbi:hypothetical protein N7474_005413 [Penicillium riverlandense]|uniref:uncharacterized protein n=1 Tax=Penicillium riverlandense TaxID=1903569 RepID=UPI002546619E|nr:uncharacterized protein N7474_005413 [Penicillium riverlandense]KAJ5819822.1 hypothetical protein N7474_005413 [Penicillium riverlandense]